MMDFSIAYKYLSNEKEPVQWSLYERGGRVVGRREGQRDASLVERERECKIVVTRKHESRYGSVDCTRIVSWEWMEEPYCEREFDKNCELGWVEQRSGIDERDKCLRENRRDSASEKGMHVSDKSESCIKVVDIIDLFFYNRQHIAELTSTEKENLANNKLGSVGCAAICRVLHANVTLRNIDMSGKARHLDIGYSNDLSDKDSQTIAEAFQENNILKYVNLSHNGFGSTDSKLLADAICGYTFGFKWTQVWKCGLNASENETIEHLDLSWNNFRLKSATCICNGIAVLKPLSNNISREENSDTRGEQARLNYYDNGGNSYIFQTNGRIRVVNLAMNGLGNEGAFGVAEILKQSGTIAHIDVSHNRIGTTGATVIGKALEGNDLLKTLKIGQNPLGVEGAKSILKGIMPEASCVVELDLTEVVVDKEFRSLKQELLASRALTSENIMTSLKKYCDVNNIEIYDALFSYDVINDRMLVADIVKALSVKDHGKLLLIQMMMVIIIIIGVAQHKHFHRGIDSLASRSLGEHHFHYTTTSYKTVLKYNVNCNTFFCYTGLLSRLLEGHTTGDGLVDIRSDIVEQ
ncbi:hypothetical protein DPMN_099176 [Dreissena polymorpha]|uniref:Protein NLRC3 n=1 Tax=Dreissena polymorpha TaxID=45954 RepID=A0A9D4LF03_DREPO|nr:hypothetical protein DPMN_099176 [Dreissena polymorpha]